VGVLPQPHARKGHNGDPFTAEDVKFSFERYKDAAAKLVKAKFPLSSSSIPTGSASD
jgi:ABC-type transport system substrate-binding protein